MGKSSKSLERRIQERISEAKRKNIPEKIVEIINNPPRMSDVSAKGQIIRNGKVVIESIIDKGHYFSYLNHAAVIHDDFGLVFELQIPLYKIGYEIVLYHPGAWERDLNEVYEEALKLHRQEEVDKMKKRAEERRDLRDRFDL